MFKKITATILALGMVTMFASAAIASKANEKAKVDLSLDANMYVGSALGNDELKADRNVDLDLRFNLETEVAKDIRVGGSVSATLPLKFDDEGDTRLFTSNDVDDAYVYVNTSFGRVVVGRSDNAAQTLHISAPNVGYGSNGANLDSFVHGKGFEKEDLAVSAFSRTSLDLENTQRVKFSYYTPSFSGFRAGVSYVPTLFREEDVGPNSPMYEGRDAFFGGVRFDHKFNDVSFGISAGLGRATHEKRMKSVMNHYYYDQSKNAYSYTLGAQVKVDRVTVGGSYAKTELYDQKATGFDVGVSYRVSKDFSASVGYQYGKNNNATRQVFTGSGAYTFTPGMTGVLTVAHVNYNKVDFVDDNGTAIADPSDNAFVVLAGVQLRF